MAGDKSFIGKGKIGKNSEQTNKEFGMQKEEMS
jgi:hypothetical protein